MCKVFLIAMLGTTSPGYTVKIHAASIAEYSSDQIAQAKRCAREYRIRWRIVGKRN